MIRRLSLAGGVIGVLLLLLSAAAALYESPRLPCTFAWQKGSWVVQDGPVPLRVGDRLLRLGGGELNGLTLLVDNSTLSSRSELLAWLEEKNRLYSILKGSQVRARLQQGDQAVELVLPVRRNSWDFLNRPGLAHLPVGLAFFVVGWATCSRPGAGRQAFWFYLMCFSMSLVYLTNAASLLAQLVFWPPLWSLFNLLNVSNFVLAPTLLLHFSLLIPRDRTAPWMLWILYGVSAVVILTVSFSAHAILVPGLFLASLLAIVQASLAHQSTVERQQMKWIGAGFALGLGPWLLMNGFPLLLLGRRLMSDTLPGAFLIFIPLGMAVAVHRYRLFDIGTFLEGTLAYVLTLALLLLCEWAVLGALGLTFAFEPTQIVLLALLASGYGMVRWKLAGLLAGWFRRRPVPSEQALELLQRRASGRAASEVPAALQSTVESLLAPEWIRLETQSSRPGARLDLEGEPSVLLGLGVCSLRCGPLPAGRYYSTETLQMLDQLARQAALYQENALLFEASLRERERLLADLHDGVGAALAGIRLLSREPEVAALAGDALFELQSFLYDSPDYQMDRQHFVAELRSYGNRLLAERDFRFEVSGELGGTLGRGLALSLFRVIREAFNNTLKHSQAKRVSLSLDFSQQIRVDIQDDGLGFSQAARGRGLVGIEKRISDLGGSLVWTTQPGVRLEIELPL